jgi:hypothetical protein
MAIQGKEKRNEKTVLAETFHANTIGSAEKI